MPENLRSTLEADNALLTEVGRVVIVWSLVTRSLSTIAFEFASNEENETFFSNGTDFNRIERAIKFWKEKCSNHPRNLDCLSALSELKKLIPVRNTIIHSLPAVTYLKNKNLCGEPRKIAVITDPKIDRFKRLEQPFDEILEEHIRKVRLNATILDDVLTEDLWKWISSIKID